MEHVQHRLNVRNDRLDLPDEHDARLWMPTQDIDGSSLAVYRERNLDMRLPAACTKVTDYGIDHSRVSLVQKPVDPFGLPADSEFDLGADRFADRAKLGERHPPDAAVLDPAPRALRDPCAPRNVLLAKLLLAAQRTNRPAEAHDVHTRTMGWRPYHRLHAELHRCTVGRAMCFDTDSRPPIAPIKGGALESHDLTLTAGDGKRFSAFAARAAKPTGAGIVILPDVRGLHAYYIDLALRFAEQGVDAVTIDYFGRTAGLGRRETGFDYMPHVNQTTFGGISADIRAAAAYLRSAEGGNVTSLFTVGFCFGGRLSFLAATLGLDLAGVIGFYGVPVGPGKSDIPAPADVAEQIASPVLALFGGADRAVPPDAVATFDAALTAAGVEHRVVSYPDAPHSFFDRKADEFAKSSEAAWAEVQAFIRSRTRQAARA